MAAKKENHLHFLTLVFLLAGFSLYLIISFFNSTNRYIDAMQASVLVANEQKSLPQVYDVFKDVRSDDVYGKALVYLRDGGIVSGYDDGTFKPDDYATRLTLVVLAATAANADFSGATYANCFSDVKAEWFAPYICYAAEKKWVSGFADNSFHLDERVSRAVALKVIMSAFAFELTPVDGQQWFMPYFVEAQKLGIVDSSAVFEPGKELTRGELSQMIYKALSAKK